MEVKNPLRCLICNDSRSHGGNKKLAALHSKITQEKSLRYAHISEKAPSKAKWNELPSEAYWRNGKKVAV